MKLNRLVLLGAASLLVTALPVASHAAAVQSPAQTVSQTAIANGSPVAQNQSVALFTGTFVAGEAPTAGTARIVTEGGHRYLELDAAFSTSNMGPDLHVLLDTTANPPQAYQSFGSSVNLGSLRDYTGAQRYPIPDAISLDTFRSVVIWCRTANATFGYAPLRPAASASR